MVAKPSRLEEGWILGRAERKSSLVIAMIWVVSVRGSLARLISLRKSRTFGEIPTELSSISTSVASVLRVSTRRLMAEEPAVETKSFRSAPTNPGVRLAR